MTIVAYSHPFVVGVDTHARKHVFAIIAVPSGERQPAGSRRGTITVTR
ncbi:UNVERIFIED_ORG: hypothetical protein J2X79_004641 [Arthrobacter globiformis]|nr:hypothetical protein [Arthrobacter globiformis]